MINSTPVTKKIVYANMHHPKKGLKCIVQKSNWGIYYIKTIAEGYFSVCYSCRSCFEHLWKEKQSLHQEWQKLSNNTSNKSHQEDEKVSSTARTPLLSISKTVQTNERYRAT